MSSLAQLNSIGIDACRAGWLLVGIDEKGEAYSEVIPSFKQLMEQLSSKAFVLLDMPIGLPDKEKRQCDAAARKVLTRLRGSSVFSVPCREAVYAANYEEACQLNLESLGVKLSKQTWNICPKVKEVDTCLQANPHYLTQVREAHPEVNFWSMNGKTPMQHSKKTKAGEAARINVMEKVFPGKTRKLLDHAFQHKSSKVLTDDILDAVCLALAASRPHQCQSLPPKPTKDAMGFPMEIVYVSL